MVERGPSLEDLEQDFETQPTGGDVIDQPIVEHASDEPVKNVPEIETPSLIDEETRIEADVTPTSIDSIVDGTVTKKPSEIEISITRVLSSNNKDEDSQDREVKDAA